METKAKKKRKKHPEEFKREAVRLMEGRGERTVRGRASLRTCFTRGSESTEARRRKSGASAVARRLKKAPRRRPEVLPAPDPLRAGVGAGEGI